MSRNYHFMHRVRKKKFLAIRKKSSPGHYKTAKIEGWKKPGSQNVREAFGTYLERGWNPSIEFETVVKSATAFNLSLHQRSRFLNH